MKLSCCVLAYFMALSISININLRATLSEAPMIHPMKGHFIDLTV